MHDTHDTDTNTEHDFSVVPAFPLPPSPVLPKPPNRSSGVTQKSLPQTGRYAETVVGDVGDRFDPTAVETLSAGAMSDVLARAEKWV